MVGLIKFINDKHCTAFRTTLVLLEENKTQRPVVSTRKHVLHTGLLSHV